ncbi:ATP-dependent RNA helicase NDAI_0A06900 [Naumovozyma dairenensis CBS 421]|uniref:RNA helicase n=1 Tax=Naumovozyma dairenensis (strain ATCC 10597 / BCRC 20456 / CBS 421 / NBRC 0211 / NRRL Y-12639) TaxID=1071378 RepID=G0W4V6_NAUDC|nr:hypothetical protein NDAI_0A06900 [Naumovozyma dairenensis CBS 421]CCD22844.1 hypothetical protein NDAI_0A06900 [Naumovozyma dairenensis CBS 421]
MDDLEDGELSSAASSDNEGGEAEEEQQEQQEEEEKDEDDDGGERKADELESNVFNADVDVDDLAPIDLPEWTNLAKFSLTILQGLQSLGFTKPTAIQAKAIPYALENADIMGKASTGSGKTLAYGIPILENLIKTAKKDSSQTDGIKNKPIALIFTPTRELAQQVTKHLQNISQLFLKNSPYAILSLTGGLSIQKQERLLKYDNSGKIVIATPGRFLELLEKNNDLIERFCQIDTLVLDEADRLLQDGHFDEFEKILKYLGQKRKELKLKKANQYWQTMIYSATFSIDLFDKLANSSWKSNKKIKQYENEMETVLHHLMNKIHFQSKPIIIDMNPDQKISSQIKESLIECAPTERDLYCYYFITMYPGSTLIFCNAIESVKKLSAMLNILKISSFQIHSSMTQKNRLKNLEKYQQQALVNTPLGKPTVLIASDVAARGLDIPDIKHVIHYHLPRSADVYIHRSGRTARADNEGVSVMVCSPQEAMGPLRKLRKVLADKSGSSKSFKNKKWQKTVPLLPIEIDIVSQLRERSKLASELADHDMASSSLRKDDNWMKKAADDLGIDIDSDEEDKDSILHRSKTKKQNKTMDKDKTKYMRAQLNELLRQPLRKDMRKKYLTGGLFNLADDLVKKRGHDTIIGFNKVDALETLKAKKNKRQKK